MQDGKALQAGTSHFLCTNFAQAKNIRFQNTNGEFELANTTSWGVSTRMIGGVIMVHGDDDGLRVPPRIAPWQIVIVPMLRDKPEDEATIDYCKALQAELAALSARGDFVAGAAAMLSEIQAALHAEAGERLRANIAKASDFAAVEKHFAEGAKNPGWLEVQWSKPTGAALEDVVKRLKALKLTVRNVLMDAAPAAGACVFTGEPAVERVLIARAY